MRKNRLLTGILAGTMVLTTLTGFSGAGKQEMYTEAAKKVNDIGKVKASSGSAAWDTSREDTVTVSVINNFYTAGEKKLAEDYMALHPETKVVIDVISDNDAYTTKMMTSMSDDRSNAPDIVHGNFLAMAVSNDNMGIAAEKGYIYDLTEMLDEENPYNEGKLVRDVFTEDDLALVLSSSGGKYNTFLPFDKIGFAFFYNKGIFEDNGLTVPETFEELTDVCEKLQEAGYDVPLSAGGESYRLLDSFADCIYRADVYPQVLIQPGDALWDEATMSANKDFKFDEGNLYCDQLTVFSDEREMAFARENGYNTEKNKAMWTEFQKIARFFPDNWISADSTQAITDFESQMAPILFQASYNAGNILADTNALPDDMKFEWATFQIDSFENTPDYFTGKIRGYWNFGNIMSIVKKDDTDHMERVKDFYKFWYSPNGAQTCFEETLNNGNYIQGPCVIEGVVLSDNLQQVLAGFEPVAPSKDGNWVTGFSRVTQADLPAFNGLINKLSEEKIDMDSFMDEMSGLYDNYVNDAISRNGYDLDPATADTPKE